jgi:hypothetical protein
VRVFFFVLYNNLEAFSFICNAILDISFDMVFRNISRALIDPSLTLFSAVIAANGIGRPIDGQTERYARFFGCNYVC